VPLVVALLPGGRRPRPFTLVVRLVCLVRGNAPATRVHIAARAVTRLREAAALRVEGLQRGSERGDIVVVEAAARAFHGIHHAVSYAPGAVGVLRRRGGRGTSMARLGALRACAAPVTS
jgi:hypothetical protein